MLVGEMDTLRPLCYYVPNDGSFNENKTTFERPDMSVHQHLRAKVEGVRINKILIDYGVCINIMPHFLLRKIGKYDTDSKLDKMVLSNYEGKTNKPSGVIQVNVLVGTTTRPTLFIVIPTKADYNLLLGREWIHEVECVPSSMHKRITI